MSCPCRADPFFGPYPFPYGYATHLSPYYGGYAYSSAVRIEVEPEETEVYVDGYYTGVVDSFDGFLQRLPSLQVGWPL